MHGARLEVGALAVGGTLFAFWLVAVRTTRSPLAAESLSTLFHREPLVLEHLICFECLQLFDHRVGCFGSLA